MTSKIRTICWRTIIPTDPPAASVIAAISTCPPGQKYKKRSNKGMSLTLLATSNVNSSKGIMTATKPAVIFLLNSLVVIPW